MTSTEVALTVYKGNQALSKDQKADYWSQAKALINAGLFPDKFANAEQAFMVALYGHEIGLSPQRAWKQIHLIKGMPCLEVHLQVAKVREAIPGLIWRIIEHTDKICVIEHGRSKDDLSKTSFTIEEADTAGLTKLAQSGKPGAWQKDKKSMLYARTAGRVVRWFYPETQGGGLLHNVEEMRDALDTPTQTLKDNLQEAKTGDGRMPKRGEAPAIDVEATVVEEQPEAQREGDTEAVMTLVAELAQTDNVNSAEMAYGNWRNEHKDKPAVLIRGYDAKENRMRQLQTKP